MNSWATISGRNFRGDFMSDTYTPDEFAKCYSLRGYGMKKYALAWMHAQGMEEANEADFERCFHDLNQEQITARGRKWIAIRIDGTNQSEPQYRGNSRGKSYNAQMMEAQREIDAADRAAKNMEVQDE